MTLGTDPSTSPAGPARAAGATPVVIDALRPADWPAAAAVYAEGIATGNATFQTETPGWAAWDAGHLAAHRLTARDGGDGRLLGWVAVSPYSGRCVYEGVVEESVYVAAAARGRGVGRALLTALLASTDAAGIWTVQAGIFPENAASVALHERCGFRAVGVRERLGRLHGAWRDVLLLERRSPVVG